MKILISRFSQHWNLIVRVGMKEGRKKGSKQGQSRVTLTKTLVGRIIIF
jgi:hypothetical protein